MNVITFNNIHFKTGLLMDKITYITGYTNYVAPFIISDVLLVGALICCCFLEGDIGLPKGAETMKVSDSLLIFAKFKAEIQNRVSKQFSQTSVLSFLSS